MGKIVNEHKVLLGGVTTESRKNEIIIIQDINDEEGHGVYIDSPGDGATSFTNSFGFGTFAGHMADILFEAVKNYYEDMYSSHAEPAEISDIQIENEEFKDDWIKIVVHTDPAQENYGEVDEDESYINGLQPLLAFVEKWGFKEIPSK